MLADAAEAVKAVWCGVVSVLPKEGKLRLNSWITGLLIAMGHAKCHGKTRMAK